MEEIKPQVINKDSLGEIASWYNGMTILVTGGTGFMGKVLLEKILYSCPGTERIYVLLRSKKGKMPETRISEMLKLPVFDRIRRDCPEVLKKLVAVHGDVACENLGLSENIRKKLQEEVNVVFHMAATLKLEAPLKDAIEMNTCGTVRIIDLCKSLKNLRSFVHLSTAFCNSDVSDLKEKVYSVPTDPSDVIQCVQWMKSDALEEATPKLIAPHPNTYLYSKRLAEGLVADTFPELPVAIARPSIVTPAALEPLPGWVDSLNGPVGVMVGAAKGVIRSMHCYPEYHAQTVPVDYAINALIAIACKTDKDRNKVTEIPVYNMTQDSVLRVTWGEILDHGRQLAEIYPFEMCLWYPDGALRKSKLMHDICVLFFHLIPAYFIDFLMIIFRQKRFMVRLQNRISQGLELLQFFTTREWVFDSRNFMGVWKSMTSEDRRRFPIDFEAVPMVKYLQDCLIGARVFCMKESMDTLPRCRLQRKLLYVLDRVTALAFYFGIGYLIISYSETARYLLDYVGEYLQGVPVIGSLVNKAYN